MQRIILLVLALTLILAVPSMAGRLTSTMITHVEQVYQAYVGTSEDPLSLCRNGYANTDLNPDGPTPGDPTISSVPGILCIDPGHYYWDPEVELPTETCDCPARWQYWRNFVKAAWVVDPDTITVDCPTGCPYEYTIKNVTLVKECPEYVQCRDIFPEKYVPQQGTANIRLWWPLMYEVPSCQFKLTILYGTPELFDDDDDGILGNGPNPPAWVHVEQWVWHVDVDLEHLGYILELFHEIPFGKDEVPLISDETLYYELQDKIADAWYWFDWGDTAMAAAILADFELEVMDACIEFSPENPNPTGLGTGIANSDENPACCKLLVDVEYILMTTGIGQPSK